MDPDQHQREKQSVIMCVIVGDVPNSGYMLRFTQEHACLRTSAKPVDMPEDSIVDVVAIYIYIFFFLMRTCQEKWVSFVLNVVSIFRCSWALDELYIIDIYICQPFWGVRCSVVPKKMEHKKVPFHQAPGVNMQSVRVTEHPPNPTNIPMRYRYSPKIVS